MNAVSDQLVRPNGKFATKPIGHHATNTHGSWHGGAAFTFADMAFGCATLYDGPALTVESSLSFLAPGTPGDRVQAEAIQLARRKQTGLFQVTLTSSSGEMLCAGMFKGRWIRSQDG